MKHRNLYFNLAVAAIILAVTLGLFYGIARRIHRQPIPTEIDPSRPMIALTFDDGPNPRYTPSILTLLYREQVPATFFLVGENIDGNEALIKEMNFSGHELEIHTFSHLDLRTLTKSEIVQEIRQTEEKLQAIIPDYKARYVRPPYGRFDEDVKENSPLPLVLWELDSGDWDQPKAAKIVEQVLASIKDKDIVIFHDDNEQTVEALKEILPELKRRGFQFVTVDQLFQYRDTSFGS